MPAIQKQWSYLSNWALTKDLNEHEDDEHQEAQANVLRRAEGQDHVPVAGALGHNGLGKASSIDIGTTGVRDLA